MPYRGVGATFKSVTGTKYIVESDGIINVTTKVNGKVVEYKEVRLVGLNHMGDCIRVIAPRDKDNKNGGPTEIPIKLITKVEDAKKNDYPCVKTQ